MAKIELDCGKVAAPAADRIIVAHARQNGETDMRRLIAFAAAATIGFANLANAQSPAPVPYSADPEFSTHPYGETPEPSEAERIEFWNSPEMREARDYVLDYSKRSKRTSQSQGEKYLEQVSRLSAHAMQQWLQQLQTVRKAREGHQLVAEAARQVRVDQAMQRIDASQQAPFNAQQSKMMIADYWQQMLEAQQPEEGEEASPNLKARIAAALEAQRLQFDPFAPAPDPISPDAYTRYAAATALPGDLPRGDSANFSTGESVDNGAGAQAAVVVPPAGTE